MRSVLMFLTVLLVAGWVSLSILASSFRRSFGASPTGPMVTLLPLALALLIWLSLQANASRLLLHSTAAAIAGIILFILWSAGGKMDPSIYLLLGYFGLWFVYYGSIVT
jgi:hypothetical protein